MCTLTIARAASVDALAVHRSNRKVSPGTNGLPRPKLREAGVAKACILARGAVSGRAGVSYEDAIEIMKPHMDIVVPVAHLDPDPSSMTPERLEELHTMGYCGIKINNTAREYDDPAYFPV
jgi:hypothetical protein